MSRASNLDNIAPDDFIITPSSPPKTTSKKVKVHKIKKLKKHISKTEIPVKEDFRNKIYQTLGKSSPLHTTFLVTPKIFDFPERQEKEEIFLVLRPHWFTNKSWVFISVLMITLPFVINFFDLLNFLPFKYIFISTLFWYLLTFIYSFEKFLQWYFNVFIVTDERVVDIDFRNMLNKHFAEADIKMIQDVSSTVKGIFGTFFNYGTILLQTASEINQITFEEVPNPDKVIKVIQQLQENNEDENNGGKK